MNCGNARFKMQNANPVLTPKGEADLPRSARMRCLHFAFCILHCP
jgi:hypothetical protein